MSDSDSESYEVIDERFSPPARNFTPKPRSFTHTGMVDTLRSSSHSPVPIDIDSRPPFPVPKSTIWGGQNNSGFLTYDRITVSPVAPDYESTSSSPPRHLTNGHLHSPNGLNPPPLPPINPRRKPPTRSHSESSDQLSQTPPRALTISSRSGLSVNSAHFAAPSQGSRLNGSSSNSDPNANPSMQCGSTVNPTYNRQGSMTKSRPSSSDSMSNYRTDGYVKSSSEMPLQIFAEKHRSDLPVQVVVTKGFYGADERNSISEGDMFNIHFFKQTKVVKVQDSNKYVYTVPLNSALEFGVVYHLPPGFKQVDSKYHFKTVSQILQLKVLPKVVRATQSYRGSGPESSVEQHDLLLLKEVKQKRGLKTTKVLKCVHAATGVKKTLTEDCAGYFSVRPQDTRLFLPEIVEHIELPQTVILYYGNGPRVDLPPHLVATEVNVIRMEIEESIVATTILEEEERHMLPQYENTPSLPLVDIPEDLDIEVAIIKLADQETDQLYTETRHLFEKFNPGQVSYLNIKSSVTASTQRTLFRTIRQDKNQQVGIEILRPPNAFRNSDQSMNRLSNGSDSSRRQLCTPSECANAEEVNRRLELLESNSQGLDTRLNKFELMLQSLERSHSDREVQKDVLATKEELSKLRKDCDGFRKTVSDVKDHVIKLEATIEGLTKILDSIKTEMQKLKEQKNQQKHATSNGLTPTQQIGTPSEFESQNREYLQRLDCSQVRRLLDALNLTQYEDAFRKEQITGEILAELNEEILQNELGMGSKIHRIKLMKIVSGRHSAISVINGEDPYYVHLAQHS